MKRLLIFAISVIAVACSVDGNSSKLNETNSRLMAGTTKQLQYNGKCSWSSDEPLIASVDNGLVKAHRVGTTYINAKSSACKVEVYPKYTTYIDPFLEWGARYASFEAIMIDNGCIEVKTDSTGSLWTDEATNTQYMCLISNGGITSSAIITSLAKLDLCTNFLLERYIPLGYVDGYGVFTSLDRQSGITISYQSKYKDEYALWVVCVPSDTRTTTNDIINVYTKLSNAQ